MTIPQFFQKAFVGGQWYVAYKEKNEKTYHTIETPKGTWIADPFLYELNGEHFIFVELYVTAKNKAGIGYYHFENNIPVFKGMIIEKPYHLSYPCVFEYYGVHYLIPESSANGTVELYIADSFPDKWRKKKTLLDDVKYVDSTVYIDESNVYLISYTMVDGYELRFFSMDMKNEELKLISKKRYKTNCARPGGRIFLEGGGRYRPAQDCTIKYGEKLIIYEIDDLNENGAFVEHKDRSISVSELQVENNPDRIHHTTSDSIYQVIDVFREKFDLFHGAKILARLMKK